MVPETSLGIGEGPVPTSRVNGDPETHKLSLVLLLVFEELTNANLLQMKTEAFLF